jgi:tetratricopeptide (TPR) repeat protein
MMRYSIYFSLALLLMLVACAGNKTPSAQEAAVKQWNSARSTVLVGLASDQYQNANFTQSRATIDQALRMSPDNASARLLSAKLYIEAGTLEAAEKELAVAARNDSTAAEADYLYGVVYQRWQQPERALECYQQACDKSPAELAYVLAKGEMLAEMGRRDEALSVLLAKVAYFEHSGEIRDEVGLLLEQEDRYPEAIEMLRRAAILAPDDLTIHEHLAMALFRGSQFADAAEQLSELLASEKYDHRPDLEFTLGECQLQIGKFTDAVETLQEASEAMPDSVGVWLALARAELQLDNYRRAEFAVRRCLALDDAGSEANLLMGYVMLREDHLDEAYASFLRASQLDQNDTVSLCMVGLTLDRLGRSQEAAKWYQRALKINPSDDMANELLARLDIHQ